jgi:thiol-disulfide isomerase/thioredoxin
MVERLHMPPFAGAAEWLNSEPLGPTELHGHVVLVNFWTLTCINWLRQEPYVRAWSQAYRDDGLLVIGVHTPEFSFEHQIEEVRRATTERGIDYPVAVDNKYSIWSAFGNNYWPALYFIDKEGIIREQHFGEGRYEQSEHIIQRRLGIERELVSVEADGVEAAADWKHLQTPETYLGYGRSERFTPADAATLEPRAYQLPKQLQVNHWALAGDWTIGRENVVLNRRPSGAGAQPPCAALAEDRCDERQGKAGVDPWDRVDDLVLTRPRSVITPPSRTGSSPTRSTAALGRRRRSRPRGRHPYLS